MLAHVYYLMTFFSTPCYHALATANIRQDVLSPNGERLNIGGITLYKRGANDDRMIFASVHRFHSPKFDDRCPPPWEVKEAAMLLLLHLSLTHYSDIHTTTDDLMRGISPTSSTYISHTSKDQNVRPQQTLSSKHS